MSSSKNRWRLFVAVASFWCIATLIFVVRTQLGWSQFENGVDDHAKHMDDRILPPPSPPSAPSTRPSRYSYATFLCDDVMAEATQVLVHSLVDRAKTTHDIVVLVLPFVSQSTRDRLEYLGAKVMAIDQIKYPWDSKQALRKGYYKACRYSKLHLWSLTDYDKIVFLDADTMVLQPLDELFDYPQLSAALDLGGVLNTGVFVAKPSESTFKDMMETYEDAPSYNRGDQGFLNYYFNHSTHYLPGNYNVMAKFMHMSMLVQSYILENTAKVIHYTSEVKPWNFFFLQNDEWRENFDGNIFSLWTRMLRESKAKLAAADGLLSSSELAPERITYVCETAIKESYGRRYRQKNMFSVVFSLKRTTGDDARLMSKLQHYLSSKKVDRIFIVNQGTISDKLRRWTRQQKRASIVVVDQPFPTPNNRFNPIQGLATSVFIIDDTVEMSIEDMEFAYKVWQQNENAIVGFQAGNHHRVSKSPVRYSISMSGETGYSFIVGNAMFLKSDWLLAYTCLLPDKVTSYLEDHPSCKDIAMNMLVSGTTSTAPILVKPSSTNTIIPPPANTRAIPYDQCINDLVSMFDGKNTLQRSKAVIVRAAE